MRVTGAAVGAAVLVGAAHAVTLDDICTSDYMTSALPAADFLPGITIDTTSVTTEIISNSTSSNDWYITEAITYCNVTIAYSHNGISGDLVHVSYWVPQPENFANRYVTTGGSGLSINAVCRASSLKPPLVPPLSCPVTDVDVKYRWLTCRARRVLSRTRPVSSWVLSLATRMAASVPLMIPGTPCSS